MTYSVPQIVLENDYMSQEQKKAWNNPDSLVIHKQLNSLSSASLVYPIRAESILFCDSKSEPTLPTHITVKVKNESASDVQDLFRGFLAEYKLDSQRSSVTLTFVDPLTTTLEIDEPNTWKGVDLKTIVDQLLSNAYEESQRTLKSRFDSPPPSITAATNMGSETDFEFIKSLSKDLGFCFYFDHFEKRTDEICFFEPDFSKAADFKVSESDYQGALLFRSRFNTFFNKVVVTGQGAEEAPLKSVSRKFSKYFRKKENLRKDIGIDLVAHFQNPNMAVPEAKQFAKARLMDALIKGGDQVEFYSSVDIPVGRYVDLVNEKHGEALESVKSNFPERVFGTYLVQTSVASYRPGADWIHHVTGVRP